MGNEQINARDGAAVSAFVNLDSELAEREVDGGWVVIVESASPLPGFRAVAVHTSGRMAHVADADTFNACKRAASTWEPL